jgi:hypothetical protein
MSHTASLITSYLVDGQEVNNSSFTYIADDENNTSMVVPAHTTNFLSSFNVTISNLRAMCLVCDQHVVIRTNSIGSPQETISLVAGKPLTWDTDESRAVPFAGNITALYLTNATNIDANFDFWSLSQQ